MFPATVKVHDANIMELKQFSVTDERVVLFHPKPGMVWVVAIVDAMEQPLSLTSGSEFAEVRTPSDANGGIVTWLFLASGAPVCLESLDGHTNLECFVGSLPKPLISIAKQSDSKTISAMRALIERICTGHEFNGNEANGLHPAQAFELFRGCASVARRLGLFSAEVQLLNKALQIRSSTNLTRLLSYAAAHAQDYTLAITAADAALSKQPELAEGPFQDHIEELRAYQEIAHELQQRPATHPSTNTSRQTIAYCLHNTLPYAHGGFAMRSHALAVAVVESGRPLLAFARPGFPSDGILPEATPSGSESIDGISYHFENLFGRRGRAYGYISEATSYFEQMFASNRIGIVHAATNFWTALPAALAARRLGLPFVYEVRSFWSVTREARQPGFIKSPQAARDEGLEAIVLALADEVVTLNKQMRDELIGRGVDCEVVTVVPNCVDAGRFAAKLPDSSLLLDYGVEAGDILIGYIGTMLHYEGLDLLIEAAAPLIESNPHIKLILVGADPKKATDPLSVEQRLSNQITGLKLSDNIRLVDRVSPDVAAQHYGVFDICVYPRRGLTVNELVSPLKPLEAMAARKTVIGSNVGGLMDIIHNDSSGLLFEKDDVGSLRAVLDRAITDEALRQRLGHNARAFVRTERSWTVAAQIIEDVYRRAERRNSGNRESLARLVAEHFDTSTIRRNVFC